MKKIITVFLLVLTLVTTTFALNTEENASLDIRIRLNNADRNIIDKQTSVYLDETGNVTDESMAVKVRISFDWSVADDEVAIIQSGDTFTFQLDEKYDVFEDLSFALQDNVSLNVEKDGNVTLIFNSLEEETKDISGQFELIVGLTEEGTESIFEENDSIVDEDVVSSVAESGGQNLYDKFGHLIKAEDNNISDLPFFTKVSLLDSGKNEVEGTLIEGDEYILAFEWKMPAAFENNAELHINAGDYIEFEIPSDNSFKIVKEQFGYIIGPDGNRWGEYSVTPQGKVKLVFNEEVYQLKDIKGAFNISGTFILGDDAEVGKHPIEIPFMKEDKYEIIVESNLDRSDHKSGELLTETPQIEWNVDFNKKMEDLDNVTITDTLEDSLFEDVDQKNFKVYEVRYDRNGKLIDGSKKLTALKPVFSTDKKEFTLEIEKTVNKNDEVVAYVLEYTSTFDKEAFRPSNETDPDSKTFTNKVLIDINGEKRNPISGKATITYEKRTEKFSTNYDRDERLISWKVNFNKGNEHLKDVVLTDTLPKFTTLKEDSLVIKNANGEVIANTSYVVSVNSDGTFTIKFNGDVTEHLVITYDTLIDSDFEFGNAQNFTNTITDGKLPGGEGSKWVDQSNIVKSTTDVDHTDKSAQWKIVINNDKRVLNSVKVTDTFTQGLTLQDDSVVVKIGDRKLVIDSEYTLKASYGSVVIDGVNLQTGFEFVLINPNPLNGEILTIEYETDFNVEWMTPGDRNNKEFVNNAKLKFVDGNDKDIESDSSSKFPINDNEKNNGVKKGVYNYDVDNKEITWDILINFNNNPLIGATLTDHIPEGLDFIKDSVELYTYTTSKKGEAIVETTPIANPKDYINDPVFTGQEMKITFKDRSIDPMQFKLVYKTKVVDKIIKASYTNNASFENNETIYPFSDKVVITKGGEVANKYGVINDSGILTWNIDVNFSQSELKNFVIEDTMTSNQILNPDSFKIYPVTVTKNSVSVSNTALNSAEVESLLEVVYPSEEETWTFKLVFKENPLKKAYRVEYQSMANLVGTEDKETVANSIVLKWNEEELIESGGSSGSHFQYSLSSGSAEGQLSFLKLVKRDQFGDLVTGTEFRITSEINKAFQKTTFSDEFGNIIFDNIPKGKYLLEEINSVSGYEMNTKFEGKTVDTINNIDGIGTILNWNNAILINKSNVDKVPLAGAEFTLYKDNEVYKPSEGYQNPVVTNASGIAEFKELEHGEYELKETKAPNGYILNATVRKFTISSEDSENKWVDIEGNGNWTIKDTEGNYNQEFNVTNHKASVSFVKSDVSGNALEGAEFKLYKLTEGNKSEIAGEFISNDLGFVRAENLEAGQYVFVEEKAPSGFVLNTKEITFTVEESYTNDTDGLVNIELEENFVNYKGSVELFKTDHKDEALVGATFELFSGDNVKIDTFITNKEGLIQVSDLSVGEYYFVETESAAGHIVNTNKIPFTIKGESEGVPEKVSVSAKNIKASIQFVKYGSNEKALAGAIFNLYAKDNLETVIATTTSSEVGLVRFENVSVGEYIILEVSSADGHIINTTPIEVSVFPETDELVVEYSLDNFINYKGSVELSKTDYKNEVLEGATFEFYNAKNELLGTYTTDEFGLIHVSDLSVGEYYFVETKSADGNIVNTNKIHFEVQDSFEGTPEVVRVSTKNIRGSVSFKKTDVLGKPLQGAKFELYNELNERVAIAESTVEGIVLVENLSPGKYYFKEVVASKGYVLNTARIEFEIEDATNLDQVHIDLSDFINYQGNLVVNKVDKNGKLLKEATFELSSKELNYKVTLSTEGGVLRVDGLSPGIYTLIEVSAPKGYQLDKKAHTFEIVERHLGALETVEISVVNIEAVVLPTTGVGSNHTVEIGLLLSALGLILIKMKLKREENN